MGRGEGGDPLPGAEAALACAGGATGEARSQGSETAEASHSPGGEDAGSSLAEKVSRYEAAAGTGVGCGKRPGFGGLSFRFALNARLRLAGLRSGRDPRNQWIRKEELRGHF